MSKRAIFYLILLTILAACGANQTADKTIDQLNKPMIAQLQSILDRDQRYRMALDSVAEKFGFDSKEVEATWKAIDQNDSINKIEVVAFLDKHGWPSAKMVGDTGSEPLFLVIQHAPLAIQDKYLPMLRAAVKNGDAKASWLALLEDRVALRHGKKQTYGTQVMGTYVLPLDDPDNVDKRRASVGLQPINEYLGNFGLTWDPADYKKLLPEIEASFAATRDTAYQRLLRNANQLYMVKQYNASALAYTKAFVRLKGAVPPDDRYNAACAWALAGNKDSAFYHLQHLANAGSFRDHAHLLEDTDLKSLHTDKRWAPVSGRIKQNQENAAKPK